MADNTTETKAQKVERLKREKYAWARFDEIKDMARQGRAAVTPEWAGTYLRSWGIYTQGDGVGVIGGKNGEYEFVALCNGWNAKILFGQNHKTP